MATFAERLRMLRREQNMKQSELADILHVSMYTVSVWERGVRKPEFSTLNDICNVFNVSLYYLLGSSDSSAAPSIRSDEELAEFAEGDDMESVQHIARTFSQLSMKSRKIVIGAISQAYQQDKEDGTLQLGYNVQVSRFVPQLPEQKDDEAEAQATEESGDEAKPTE